MRAKELELLSPAGNIEIFKSAIDAGADAVYFGGDLFGARAYAKNFSIEEGTEAIRYAHLYGRQAYLTVNTLLKNLEIERDLYKYIRAYYEAGLDAVIVQDMGVFAMLRSYFPDLALHASTQMTLAGADGAALLQKQGASRIIHQYPDQTDDSCVTCICAIVYGDRWITVRYFIEQSIFSLKIGCFYADSAGCKKHWWIGFCYQGE